MTSPTESPDVEAVVAGLDQIRCHGVAQWIEEIVTDAISLLEGVPQPWQVALPKITQTVLQEWQGHPELIELTDEGPQWTENAVDFACMLQETAHGPQPAPASSREALLERAARAVEHCASLPDTTPSGARMAAEDASTLRALAVNLTQQMDSAALALAQTPQRYKGAVGEVASQWQPIATAPRDRLVLVRDGIGGGFFDLAFFNGIYWHDQGMRSLTRQPVEWREVEPTTAKEAR